MIPDEAVEAAARALAEIGGQPHNWANYRNPARAALEAAAPRMLSHEREQTRLAHIDAMVNRETKREELAAAWDEGYRECYERQMYEPVPVNPYRKAPDA